MPTGELIAIPARGTLTGNRGIIHTREKKIVRQWQSKAWITCLLKFKNHHRAVMSPNTWTELFFLDEVTAFAAGHRPCAFCRRQDFNKFKDLWMAANPNLVTGHSIKLVDGFLHKERVSESKGKLTYNHNLKNLPDGVMFMLPAVTNQYFALRKNRVLKWTPRGYEAHPTISRETSVRVLTPPSVVNTFTRGYEPKFHESIVSG